MPAYRFLLVLTLLPAVAPPPAASAAGPDKPGAVGVKVQAYPAGVILAARASYAFDDRNALLAYAAYNATDRRDFGKHENEEGGGPGFGFAWRHYLRSRYRGIHVGVRTDLWFLGIDWEDDGKTRTGTTDVVVLQPTAQIGYSRTVAGDRLVLEATVALGAEINVDTRGEAVGQGAILLGGLGISYRL